jgi:DNA-binding transcriptional LysR family regulator
MSNTIDGSSGKNNERSKGRREANGLSIGALRAFVTIVDQGSFSKAAQELGVSQPNVSNQIIALEQACGVRLLHRRTQNQTLTEAGRELYTRARLVINRMDDFEFIARQFIGLKRGRLVVGYSIPSVALKLIGHFMRTYPDIEVSAKHGNTNDLLGSLGDCRIDVALISLLEPDSTLACHLVAPQGLNLLIPASHPFASRSEIHVEDLSGLALVTREEGSVTRALTILAHKQVGLEFRPVFSVESREAIKEAVVNGMGFGTILDGEIGEDKRLKALPLLGLEQKAGVYLTCLKENLEIPAVNSFIRMSNGGI